jgi:ABC-2 type transport system permease protein
MTTATAAVAARRHSDVPTFFALLARDVRVLRRELGQFVMRTVMQPLLFVFVFAYVFPKIGQGFSGGVAGHGGPSAFTTVLVPGLVAVAIIFQGMQAVALTLVRELDFTRELEDRVLAPVPVWAVGLEKMVSGTVQAIIAAAVVFPVVYLVHAKGAAPSIHVAHWALFVVAVLFSSLLAAAFGLFIGTVLEARKLNVLFVVIVLPVTFLGCIYYPWAALGPIPWLKYLTLVNPLVYMSESLRASLTPQLPHMPTWGFLLALIGGTLIMGYVGLRSFTHRVLN